MAHDTMTMTCDCCHGDLPMRQVWEARRDAGAECTGSVDAQGRCRAYGDDAWELHDMAVALLHAGHSGIGVVDEAQEWLDCGITPARAAGWYGVDVRDAATATECERRISRQAAGRVIAYPDDEPPMVVAAPEDCRGRRCVEITPDSVIAALVAHERHWADWDIDEELVSLYFDLDADDI